MSDDTIVWISGATEGIGKGLADNVPWPDARVINLSRRQHPELETVTFDLARPETWGAVRAHFEAELSRFKGRRAIFIQNAYQSNVVGLIHKAPSESYEAGVIANVAAPLVLGEAFIKACRPGYEAGLVMMSSGAAVTPLVGLATYCASKTAIEHWAEVAQREREARGEGPWVVAIRPGGVETEPVRRIATLDPELYPRARRIAANIPNRLSPDEAAKQIWKVLPPKPGVSVISFAPDLPEAEFRFGGARERVVDVPGWRLVYV
jgi:benzil reductase ((S)-benzoin forming)